MNESGVHGFYDVKKGMKGPQITPVRCSGPTGPRWRDVRFATTGADYAERINDYACSWQQSLPNLDELGIFWLMV